MNDLPPPLADRPCGPDCRLGRSVACQARDELAAFRVRRSGSDGLSSLFRRLVSVKEHRRIFRFGDGSPQDFGQRTTHSARVDFR